VDIVSSVETCYRHPRRETGVSCSSCGRPICPECMTPTPVGMRCPECSNQRTKVKTAATLGRADTPVVTYILIGICTALQLGQMAAGASATGGGLGGSDLAVHYGLFGPAVADGQVYRIVTSGFLHSGFLHLALNMYTLWILGAILEPAVGRMRFSLIYAVSLLAGSFGALLVSPNNLTVGASGAVFGLMSAAVLVLRQRGIDPMQTGLPLWIGINLVFSFVVPGISYGAHVGGLVGGALAAIALYEVPARVRSLPSAAGPVLAAAVGVFAVAGALAVV
jgi:membrane associated rhomboid family serine protease